MCAWLVRSHWPEITVWSRPIKPVSATTSLTWIGRSRQGAAPSGQSAIGEQVRLFCLVGALRHRYGMDPGSPPASLLLRPRTTKGESRANLERRRLADASPFVILGRSRSEANCGDPRIHAVRGEVLRRHKQCSRRTRPGMKHVDRHPSRGWKSLPYFFHGAVLALTAIRPALAFTSVIIPRNPIVWAMRWYLTAGSSTAPVSIWPTIERWISCQGDWWGGIFVAATGLQLRAAALKLPAGTRMSAVPLSRSMRTRSPVFRMARPPPAAASGEALRIDGEPDVPDWRPSPMQGSEWMPRFKQIVGRAHVDDFRGTPDSRSARRRA